MNTGRGPSGHSGSGGDRRVVLAPPLQRRGVTISTSTATTNKTKASALAHVQAMIAGTAKHFPSGSFTIGSTVYTSASMIQVLQGLANAMTARDAAEAGAKDARAAEQAAQTRVGPILLAYKRLVLAAFANTAQTLTDFGLTPPRARTPLTTEQLAARAAKTKATRAARGTTSRKQKLAVKGKVTGVFVTPITGPTAAPPPAPAASASPASPVTPVTPVATPHAPPVSTAS